MFVLCWFCVSSFMGSRSGYLCLFGATTQHVGRTSGGLGRRFPRIALRAHGSFFSDTVERVSKKQTAHALSLLGLPATASPDETRASYKRLVKKLHPDVAGMQCQDQFRSVVDAYKLVTDGNGASLVSPADQATTEKILEAWRQMELKRARTGRIYRAKLRARWWFLTQSNDPQMCSLRAAAGFAAFHPWYASALEFSLPAIS